MEIKNGDKAATPFQPCGPDGLPSHEAEFCLTKREMMAMHMMAATQSKDGKPDFQYEAIMAVKAADALLAELERTSSSK